MYLLHLRPLFVELSIFVPGALVLLEPCDWCVSRPVGTCGAAPLTCAAGKSTATVKLNGSLPVYVPAARASSASSCDAPVRAAA